MLLAVLSGFIIAILVVPLGKWLRGKWSLLIALLPTTLFIYFFSKISEVSSAGSILQKMEWIPQMGVNLDFNLDGLSLIFALMITGVGALVFIYTSSYLKNHEYLDRFFGYLCLFMAAMLGLVLSDNLITLFIFWELTSISSFFLIGFNNKEAGSRKSALIALAITGIGGLCLLTAAIIANHITGTYSIVEIIQSDIAFQNNGLYLALVCMVFGAAFTKSAQFPFHFWLPEAMKAPTPVSTYLHSATMVKAGIYLLFRLSPALSGPDFWHYSLWIFGGVTMLYAAVQTLFKDDLKSILAYTTISVLGILVFLIGIGTDEAMLAALIFVLVHASYKATLFLMTGIIDHETHTRQVSQLSGLGKLMMPVALAGFLAALSHSGFPPSFGFLGKELIYEASVHTQILPIISTIALIATNILLVFAGFSVGVRPFIGKPREAHQKVKAGSPLMWMPTLILAVFCILFGLAPSLVEDTLIAPGMQALGMGHFEFHLKLWHGFNLILGLSAITIGLGLLLFFLIKPSKSREDNMMKWEQFAPKAIFENLAIVFQQFSSFLTGKIQNGYLRNYVLVIVLFLMGMMVYGLDNGFELNIDYNQLYQLTIYEIAIIIIMLGGIIFAVSTHSRLTAVVSMGVVGYSICLLFVFYSAPDLAMTQFAIDTLTVILFVLVLYRLPKYLPFSKNSNRIRDGIVSLAFGSMITLLALSVLTQPMVPEIGNFYAENAYELANGKNVVNVILVDFRGMDTLIEISVLVIAGLGVFGLMKLKLKSKEKNR